MTFLLFSLNLIIWSLLGYYLFKKHQEALSLKSQLDTLESNLHQVAKDHPVLVHADLVFAQQIRDITSQLVSMDTQLQHLENIRDNDGAYQHAVKILQMGGDKEEIVENCHLSNAEAELLMNLQAYRAAIGDLKELS